MVREIVLGLSVTGFSLTYTSHGEGYYITALDFADTFIQSNLQGSRLLVVQLARVRVEVRIVSGGLSITTVNISLYYTLLQLYTGAVLGAGRPGNCPGRGVRGRRRGHNSL